ncbi:MAG: hypothetical protein LBC74_08160, partial [Planctomycetaceae bacterium]|nr:hypothetical protein [Planctomycetaceae bacterium]
MRLNYKRIIVFFALSIFFCLGSMLSIAEDETAVWATDAIVKELLLEIETTNKICKEKSFFPKVPPYPSTRGEDDKIGTDVFTTLGADGRIYRSLSFNSYIDKNNVKYKFKRKDRAELFLAFILNSREAIDP